MSAITLDRSISLGSLWTAFTLSMRNLCRLRRLLALAVLFLMPVVLLIVFRTVAIPDITKNQQQIVMRQQGDGTWKEVRQNLDPDRLPREMMRAEFISVFWIIAIVAAPLTILLFASGMIRDEQEDQTLTYLMVRPVPRWAIYFTKLLASIIVAWILTILGIAVALLTLWWGSNEPPTAGVLARFFWMALAFLLLIAVNGSVFAFVGVFFRRSLIIGAVYIAVFEGFLANFPFVLRKFTTMHYFQCIIRNLIGDDYMKWNRSRTDPVFMWSIANEVVPDTQECVITLMVVMLLASLLGMYFFSTREFRMKTPEGN
jgi:ABC-2 type transport system permease protein